MYFVGEDEGWRMRGRATCAWTATGHWPAVDESRSAVTTGGSVAEPFWRGGLGLGEKQKTNASYITTSAS